MTAPGVTAIVPAGIDDPTRPSGGNRYDRRVLDALAMLGCQVDEVPVTGSWPEPDATARDRLTGVLDGVDTGTPVLIDGLIASSAADLVLAAAARLPVVVLMHMPLGPARPRVAAAERAMLRGVAGVLATSGWTRRLLISRYGVPDERIRVAVPGADPAPVTRPGPTGGRLLCVAAVTRGKGYDVLIRALSGLREGGDRDGGAWQCTCAGSLDLDPDFARDLHRSVRSHGLTGRVRFTGALHGAVLDHRYADADLLVLPSRAETWGMVITEALARGIPVLASDVGGIPEAVGQAPDGTRPGLLVPPGDAGALAHAVRRWLSDAPLRDRLRAAALARRSAQPGWTATAGQVSRALAAAIRAARSSTDRERPVAGGLRAWSR